MEKIKSLFDQCQEMDWVPGHNCSRNKIILVETHSVNSLHNIVIYRKAKCRICGKIIEQSDPEGIK